jgi:hypothetical protein
VARHDYLICTIQAVHSECCRFKDQIFEGPEEGDQSSPVFRVVAICDLGVDIGSGFLPRDVLDLEWVKFSLLVDVQRYRSTFFEQHGSVEGGDFYPVIGLNAIKLVVDSYKIILDGVVEQYHVFV